MGVFVRDCLDRISVGGARPVGAVSFAGQVVLDGGFKSEQAAFLQGFFFQGLPSLPSLVDYDLQV